MRSLSPAKINLYLDVTGKRPNGYHNIDSLICAVSLFDSVLISFSQNNEIRVISDNVILPRTEKNIVYSSIVFFLKKISSLGIHSDLGVRVCIWKKIPIGSGFGGGSSNAATAIALLNEKFGYPFSFQNLIKIGKEIGADVPFFFLKKPAIISGIGNKLEYPSLKLPKFAVIIYTGFQISTESVFSSFNIKNKMRLTKETKKISRSVRCETFDCYDNLSNTLEYSVNKSYSSVYEAKRQLFELGSTGSIMSGSGSGVFGLYTNFAEASLSAKILSNLNSKWFVRVVTLLS